MFFLNENDIETLIIVMKYITKEFSNSKVKISFQNEDKTRI